MPVEIRVPQLGESVVEATITRWLKHEGDPVAAGDVLAELETDKVNVEVVAEQPGVLERIARHEGETVAVDEVIALVAEKATATPTAQATSSAVTVETAPPAAQPAAQGNGRPTPAASPVAARLAADKGIDLSQVPGSGPGGKVLKEDVENFQGRGVQAPAPPQTPPPPPAARAERPAATPAPLPALTPPSELREERVRMSRRRQTIALRLVEAQRTAAMLTTFNEVDMSAVMEVRKRRRDSFKERHGVGLGFMSFFTKATVGALKAFPRLNAEIQGDEMLLKYHYDIGIAVSTEEGLVVPVLRDADRKSFAEIEREIGELATRAREGKLTLPELMGGTFTITNGGVFGSLMSTPILNAPQVGILGMHKIEERPVAVNGVVVIRPMMYLALSYDHRIVDGSEAVRFLVRIKELVEDPETLLLEG
ncbi:MAG TPA: 2-oxoglutarate dehydrogenase complex dihydrolipoyllysine-residue succinyltransferase [Chthonomonadaceae bacterium]|nr:2-oxoglutarate dehydrogenase complex dihydrolipoyllysine-residue succinyltransferase [Chthonomonadaceae bacterium]